MSLEESRLQKIRSIELKSRKLTQELFSGVYRAAFKGNGYEFVSVRPYEPGDDVRQIDWNTTARTGLPYVKQFHEERELTILFILDTSASMMLGSVCKTKIDVIIELCVLLATSAIHNNDRAGLLLLSQSKKRYLEPRKGRPHLWKLIQELLAIQPADAPNFGESLRIASRLLKRRSIIFIISDFLMPVDSYATELAVLSNHHDVIGILVSDPLERKWPDVGLVRIYDLETGFPVYFDTSDQSWQRRFNAQSAHFYEIVKAAFARCQSDFLYLDLASDYMNSLVSFFQKRAQHISS